MQVYNSKSLKFGSQTFSRSSHIFISSLSQGPSPSLSGIYYSNQVLTTSKYSPKKAKKDQS